MSKRARKTEKRLSGFGMGAAIGFPSTMGAHGAVATAAAENLSAVLACVELISGEISSLPASLTVDTPDGGRKPAPSTAPAWRLLTRPNTYQSWPAFTSWLVSNILLYGNGVAAIQSDLRGAVMGLLPVPWPWVLPSIISSGTGARLVYDVVHSTPEIALLGLPRRLLSGDVVHCKARSDFGLIGRSVLSRASGPVREGIEISTLAAANWRNSVRPSGFIKYEKILTDTQRKQFRETAMPEFTGAINGGKVPILEAGMEWLPMSLSSQDSELLASRQFSLAEIARLFCVPEPLLQIAQRIPPDMAAFQTLFAQQALSPLVSIIEHEFDHAVLSAGMHLSLDLDGLMRGSFSATVAGMAALKQSGIISANDAREELGWPAVDGGDVLGIGPAPNWPSDAAGMPHLGPSPGHTGDGPPAPGNNQNGGAT